MSTGKEIVVSVHIEKTGGTSLQDFFERVFGREAVLLYIPTLNILVKSSDAALPRTHPLLDSLKYCLGNSRLLPLFIQAFNCLNQATMPQKAVDPSHLPPQTRVIHGHLTADKFDSQIPFPFPVTVIREPLERMRSHFSHWQRSRGQTNWPFHLLYDPSLTFEDFALLDSLRNYQTQALAGKGLESFALVGITEQLGLFAFSLTRLLTPPAPASLKKLNLAPPASSSPTVSPDFHRLFQSTHAADYDLYRQAKNLALSSSSPS